MFIFIPLFYKYQWIWWYIFRPLNPALSHMWWCGFNWAIPGGLGGDAEESWGCWERCEIFEEGNCGAWISRGQQWYKHLGKGRTFRFALLPWPLKVLVLWTFDHMWIRLVCYSLDICKAKLEEGWMHAPRKELRYLHSGNPEGLHNMQKPCNFKSEWKKEMFGKVGK